MMNQLPSFDHLKNLYDCEPEAFEELRVALIQYCIDSAPDDRRNRLQGLQFHIDARRSIAKTPMESCITISKMMHEKFWGLHDSLEDLSATQSIIKDDSRIVNTDNVKSQPIPLKDKASENKSAEILQLRNLN
jgi:hypothetical protein